MGKAGHDATGRSVVSRAMPPVVTPRPAELETQTPGPTLERLIGVPAAALTAETPDPSLAYEIATPAATLTAETPEPEVTGVGDVGVSVPADTLEAQTPGPVVGFAHWHLDDDELKTATGETATHRSVILSLRMDTEGMLNRVRKVKRHEGRVDVLVTDDGGFTAVDRADDENTFDLVPPATRRPLRDAGGYHVAAYEETLVSADVGEWDVTVEFVRADNRDDEPSLDETADADEWEIDTRFGTLATDRVSADFAGTGADGVERFEVGLTLTFAQAHVLEAALARLDGARIREIPDGPNAPVDDTPDAGNTLGIDAPGSDDVVPNDEYVVVEPFESERLNDEFQRISLEIARKPD